MNIYYDLLNRQKQKLLEIDFPSSILKCNFQNCSGMEQYLPKIYKNDSENWISGIQAMDLNRQESLVTISSPVCFTPAGNNAQNKPGFILVSLLKFWVRRMVVYNEK